VIEKNVSSSSGIGRLITEHEFIDGGEPVRMTGAAAAKGLLRGLCLAMVTTLGAGDAMAIEEVAYTVVTRDGAFRDPRHAPHVVAETLVGDPREPAKLSRGLPLHPAQPLPRRWR
jgi:hypothetical protein